MTRSITYCLRMGAVLLLLLTFITAGAQHYVPVKKSAVEYHVYSHKGATNMFRGLFSDIKGNITFDPKHLDKASFDITVKASSISTANTQRDKDLTGPSFLSAAKYPDIRIKSTSITSDGKVVYILHGNLTLHGITKPVNIQFTATQLANGYLFRGSFRVDRMQYGVGTKGDEIDNMVTLFIELRTAKA
jgi:polyisoprenoid-binding protein YceI